MENNIIYPTNTYQTQITKELKKSLKKEIFTELMDTIGSVEFIRNLIAVEDVRGFAKDRPKNKDFKDGRIEVSLTKPHILENMDFFRERALFFNEHGRYTNLMPDRNKMSEYGRFWKEETRRWKHGYVRPSDGEWIPGTLYFYWNYAPIWLTADVAKSEGATKSQGERIRSFANPWSGDYLFYHYMEQGQRAGMHGKLLKTRGVGYSFKMGALSPRNMYVYPGTGNPNFHLANSKSYLSGNSGIWGKVIDTLDWISDYTPLPRMRLIDSNRDMLVEMGYKDPYGVRRGLGSSVKAISLKDDPEKARGVRGPLIHYEEDGLFDNLERAWGINRKAVEDGNTSFGYMLAGGTGGTEGASFEGSEKLFYYPRTYNVYPLPNIFDRDADGSSECGFFWGAYMNRKDCYDLKTGESDVIKALIEILEDRYVVKYAASDTQAITQKKAEEPITPQEAVMRMTGTVFPVNDLKTYLEEISVRRESFVSEHYIGDLVKKTDGSIQFVPSADNVPLRSYDKVPTDRSGGIEIFTMPRTNANGEIPFGRYIAGIDPIDADMGASLFSVMIMDTFTDRIVAEYTGRPRFADQAYETTLRLLEFYNAEANYEQNLKGIFSYFEKNRALHRLCNTPQILRDMDYVKGATLYGNNAKGTRANKEVNKWGRVLQAEWQKSFDDGIDDRKDAYDEEGNPRKLKLHSLRGIAYIEECIRWNEDGNFDRVSSGGMLFILREDRFQRTQSLKNNDGIGSDLAKDKFFNKNYSFGNQNNNHIL